jgi:exosortase A-associated hydrolase 1
MQPAQGSPAERFLVFDCQGDACVGVLAVPSNGQASANMGVVIVVGGPQYRVGSHRQFGLLARALAEAGLPVFRFDYRGMGDSEGETRTFESIGDDISAAITAMQREAAVSRVVLWGLCDGASAALMYAADDPRVAGIVALNPWARSPRGEARTRLKYYYSRRIFTGAFWRKLLRGDFDVQRSSDAVVNAVREASGDARPAVETDYLWRMQQGWSRFRRPVLFILSGNDFTAREFEDWIGSDKALSDLFHGALSETVAIEGADHTVSNSAWRTTVSKETIDWIRRLV